MKIEEKLAAGISEMGLGLDEQTQKKLLDYMGLLHKWNKVYNLTAIREPQKMVDQHLLDSLAVLPYLVGKSLIDVGSGAGIPGIPLAIANPALTVVVLDSNHKKTVFAQQACIELGLKNVTVVCERVENWRPAEKYDMVISRAFTDLSEFERLTRHLRAIGGCQLAMKGVYPNEELAQLAPEIKVKQVIRLSVPGLNAQRHLVVIKAD